jgi:hypothetical protein
VLLVEIGPGHQPVQAQAIIGLVAQRVIAFQAAVDKAAPEMGVTRIPEFGIEFLKLLLDFCIGYLTP